MAQASIDAKPAAQPTRFERAFKDAFIAALVMLGLSVPILALRAEQNMSNEVILIPRCAGRKAAR
jgi:hypothetical protein